MDFRIEKFSISKDSAMLFNIVNTNRPFTHILPGDYERLMDSKNTLWMSDSTMERKTNSRFVNAAEGDVLVFGLGLALIVKMLNEKDAWGKITSLTIVERYQGVIDLVGSRIKDNPKITIVLGDAFEYNINKYYDVIYFDIWPDICEDNLAEMNRLKGRVFGMCEKVMCWSEDLISCLYCEEANDDCGCYRCDYCDKVEDECWCDFCDECSEQVNCTCLS